jgi:GT2 family glycosyltransferase
MQSHGVSIVIPTWNGRHLLQQFLPSVIAAADYFREAAHEPVEIIVVDDGSTDGTAGWLRATHPEIIVLKKEENEGFAPSCNLGFAHAKHPIIFLLNNDVAVEKDVLTHLVRHFSDSSVFAVCCKDIEPHTGTTATAGKYGEFKQGFWRVYRNYDVVSGQWSVVSSQPDLRPQTSDLRPQSPTTSDQQCATNDQAVANDQRPTTNDIVAFPSILASGGFSAFDAEKLKQLGGFNPLLAPFYWEDADLSLRAWKRGWRILYEPRAIVYHATSSTIGPHFERHEIDFIAQRNRLITHWINLHDRLWLAEHIGMVVLLVLMSILTLNFTFLRAFVAALKKLPAIVEQRREERDAMKMSDRQLARLIAAVGRRPEVFFLERSSQP